MEKSKTIIHEENLLRCCLRNPSSFEDFQLKTQSFFYKERPKLLNWFFWSKF